MVGSKVMFHRGMFGQWPGTVRSIYASRVWNIRGMAAKVSYVRKNGSRGDRVCPLESLSLVVDGVIVAPASGVGGAA